MSRAPRAMLFSTVMALAVLQVVAIKNFIHAQPVPPKKEKNEPSNVVEYRRVFVPEEQLLKMGQHYFPVTQEQFDSLLHDQRRLAVNSQVPATRILSAEYSARFEKDSLVAGTGTIEISHTAETTGVVSFDDCNLPITNAAWRPAREGPPPLGASSDGHIISLVEKSGTLQLQWTLQGRPAAVDELEFDVRLPAAPLNRLNIALPPEMMLASSHGVVTKIKPTGATPKNKPPPKPTLPATIEIPSDQIWQVDLGGQTQTRLRIVAENMANVERGRSRLRQSDFYEITAAELRLRSELRLDVEKLPLRHLIVDVSPELRIVQVVVGEKPLAFEIQNPPGNADPQLVVEFTDPLSGHDRLVRIQAVAASSLNELRSLPMLRPRDVTWSEGNTSITVRDPLAVQEIDVSRGRQTQFNTNLANGGESFLFQQYARDSNVRLRLQRKSTPVKIASGTTINLDATTLSAHLLADLQGEYGARFEFDADVSAEWVIDDVITIPGEHLDDYDVTPASANTKQRIHIRLRNAVTPQRSVRVSIRAHRRTPAENISLNVDQLRLADFRDVRAAKRLLVLNAESNWKAELANDFGVERVDAQKLTSGESALVTVHSGSIVLRDDEASQRLKVQFRPSRPEFTAYLSVRASVTGQALSEDYRLHIVPDRTTLDKLLVHFSESRDEPLVWMLDGPVIPTLVTRRLNDVEAGGLGLQSGEVWELTFRSPRGSEFEIRATRASPLRDDETHPLTVSLVSLPQATLQTGTVEVSALDFPVTVQSDGMTHVPSVTMPAREINSRIDALRYDPGQNRRVTLNRVLTSESQSPLTAWAWSCDFISHLGQPHRNTNEAIYRLENAGAKEIVFDMTVGLSLDRVLVDGIETPIAVNGKVLQVPLPTNIRFPTVVLHYTTPPVPPRFVNRIAITKPHAKFPVLQERWTVWMPSDMVAKIENPISPDVAESLSWQVRLFGPLWRHGAISSHSDALVPFGYGDRQEQARQANEILVNFGIAAATALSTAKADERPARWRQIVSFYKKKSTPAVPPTPSRSDDIVPPPPPPLTMVLDGKTLAEIGIYADTEIQGISPNEGESAAQFADRFMKHFGLAVVVDGPRAVLTSDTRLALLKTQSFSTAERTVAFLRRADNTRDNASMSLFPPQDCWNLETWDGAGNLPPSPWRVQKSSIASDLAYSSWHAYRLPLSDSSGGAITVYQTNSLLTLAVAAMMISLSVAVWLCRSKLWQPILVLVSVAIALTLACPLAWVAIFRGILWGAIGGAAVATMRPSIPRPSSNASQSTVTKLIIGGIGRCVLLAMVGAAIAEGVLPFVTAVEPNARPEIPQVLIAVDKDNKPVGKYVRLPRDFYHMLSRQASTQKKVSHNWLLVGASYTGTLTTDPQSERLDLQELNAAFDLEIFQPGPVTLALGRDKINLLNDRATLNGQPITVDWDAEGRGITFEAEDVGDARLEIAVRPVVQRFEGLSGFDWKIPRLPAAKLRLRLPTGNEQITVPTALGGVALQAASGTLSAELGPTNQLSVRWPAIGLPLDRSRSASVDQMLWLRAKAGSVVLETKLVVTPPQGKSLSPLTLAVDPRLTFLSLREEPQVARHDIREGDPREIRVTFKDGTDRPVTLQFSFLLAGSSGVGQLAFPYVEVLNAPTTRTWGAISIAPPLQLDLADTLPSDTLDSAMFMEAWGKSEFVPHSAYRLSAKGTAVQFPLRYARSRTTAREAIEVLVGRRKVEMRCSAEVRTVEGSVFQHQVTVPKGFVPVDVSVIADDSERVVRWSMSDETSLRIMLNNPLSGDHVLFIRGEMRPPASGALELSLPRVAADELLVRDINIYRDEETHATLTPTSSWEQVKDSKPGQYFDGLGRLVARLQNKPGNSNLDPLFAKLVATANQISLRGRIYTIVEHLDQWRTTVECRLHVERGTLEVMRFEIPAEWSGPFEIEPAADYTITKIPGQSRQQLLVRPRESLKGECRVRIRGPLAAAATREHVPEVVPLDLEQVEMFVVVPTHVKSQKIEWETSFLQAVPLPEEISSNPSLTDDAAYRVTGARFRAAIRQVEQRLGDPYVALADYAVTVRMGNEFAATATFDCQPAGRQSCTIELPVDMELIHLYVDGRSPTLTRHDNRNWIVPLGAEQLMQRIELIYRGTARPASAGSESSADVPTPIIVDWPVRNTIWSIQAPQAPHSADESSDGRAGPLQNDQIRLHELFEITQLRGDLAAAHNIEEIYDWFKPWRQRLLIERRELQQNVLIANQNPSQFVVPKDVTNQIEKLLKQTADSPTADGTDSNEAMASTAVADIWRATPMDAPYRLQGAASSFVPSLKLPQFHAQPSDLPKRIFHLVMAMAIAVVIVSRPSIYKLPLTWCRRRPYLMLAMLGLGWWLFLIFGWIGLILFCWGIGGTLLQSLRTKDKSAIILHAFNKK